MPDDRPTRRSWLRRIFGSTIAAPAAGGRRLELDGAAAVALVEAQISDAAALGAAWPASLAARTWEDALSEAFERLADVPRSVALQQPRETLAAAVGLAASGQRATAFLAGSDLTACLDLMQRAAAWHLPLVVHLTCTSPARQFVTDGTGHEAYHALCDAGWVLLLATGVQDAVDLTLIARRVAEQALVPVLVAMDVGTATRSQEVFLPATEFLREWLGRPWEMIQPVGEAQRMVFGRTRRRVPRWHDPDHPVLLGPRADALAAWLAAVADAEMWAADVAGMLDEGVRDYAEQTGRSPDAVVRRGPAKARTQLVVQGSAFEVVAEALERIRPRDVAVVGLRRLRPLPVDGLREALRGATTIAALERVCPARYGEGPLLRELRAALESPQPRLVNVFYGFGGESLRPVDVAALLERLCADPLTPLYLGLAPDRPTEYPKLESLVAELKRHWPDFASRCVASEASESSDVSARPAGPQQAAGTAARVGDGSPTLRESTPAGGGWPPSTSGGGYPPSDRPVPAAARVIKRTDAAYDALPRFFDHVEVLYREGRADELRPEPRLATGTVPPLSSVLRDVRSPSGLLPVFDAEACDGSGVLWTSCPDGSVLPLVTSVRSLLEAGIELAGEQGRAVDELRGIVGSLATRAHRMIKRAESRAVRPAEVLREAFAKLSESYDQPRRKSLSEALEAVLEQIEPLTLAKTKPFFDDAEAVKPGSGELFGLIVNPDTCRCPELLLAVGQGLGLKAEQAGEQTIAAARRLYQLWEKLPDVRGETIARAREHPDVGELAACMLSRHCLLALAPGDSSEPGSGAALVLRRFMAVAEAELQPRMQRLLEQVAKLREAIAGRIRELLAEALPADDLDALAEGVEALGRTDFDLARLAERVEQAAGSGHVDGERLGRLVDCARGLADLHWRLREGVNRLGRARLGLLLTADGPSRGLACFPYNPFAVPATVDAHDEPTALARGLIEGHIRQTLAAVRLLRWAQIELERPQEARQIEALERLDWSDLSPDERRLCPPLVVVADARTLGTSGLGQVVSLLASGLPVKLLVLNELGDGLDEGLAAGAGGAYPAGQTGELGLLALLARETFVVQSSLATPDHFARGVRRALAFDGPALVHVHTPSPQRHGFEPRRLLEQADLAVRTRAWPVFSYDPQAEGVFGSRIDLSGNHDVEAVWCRDEGGRDLTPASWAASERRFAGHFGGTAAGSQPPTTGDGGQSPSTGSMEIDTASLSAAMQAFVERQQRFWRTLQELSGVVTPFTQRVREQVEAELRAQHDQQIEQLKREHAQKLAELERSFTAAATQRVTNRLLQLAGYHPRQDNGQENQA